jgi:hypothetical protein
MSPEARWIPFTAEEFTDTTGSNFRWDACLDPGAGRAYPWKYARIIVSRCVLQEESVAERGHHVYGFDYTCM